MMLRWLFLLMVLVLTKNISAQVISNMIAEGKDWRMCGTYEDRDTLEFRKYDIQAPIQDCNGKAVTQLLTYPGNKFRFLNWNKGNCLINEPGMIEVNDANGEIRFYFDDGSSRDFLMIFLNKNKLILVDKNY